MMYQLKIDNSLGNEADALSNVLEEMGALSVTLTDRYDSPILEPEIGTTPLWPDVVIEAVYPDAEHGQRACVYLSTNYPRLTLSFEPIPEQDWIRMCMADFQPQQFGTRLWICPSWSTPPEPEAINLTLDPGLAFGTGTHPTTALCLTWLEQADLKNKQVIDYGCGSGILALAALKLGANHVAAVDLDPQALIATRDNAAINQLSESSLTVSLPGTLNEPVDLLIANILLQPLLELQPAFRRLVKPGGTLVVSGILNEQVIELIAAYQHDFKHVSTLIQKDWSMVVLT